MHIVHHIAVEERHRRSRPTWLRLVAFLMTARAWTADAIVDSVCESSVGGDADGGYTPAAAHTVQSRHGCKSTASTLLGKSVKPLHMRGLHGGNTEGAERDDFHGDRLFHWPACGGLLQTV